MLQAEESTRKSIQRIQDLVTIFKSAQSPPPPSWDFTIMSHCLSFCTFVKLWCVLQECSVSLYGIGIGALRNGLAGRCVKPTDRWSLLPFLIFWSPLAPLCTTRCTVHKHMFCLQSMFVCYVCFLQRSEIMFILTINHLVFETETECVYCVIWTEYFKCNAG